MKGIEESLRKYIAECLIFSENGYPYLDNASFLKEGIIDSANILELVMFVEEHYHIQILDEDVIPENFDSVSRIAAYVRSKLCTCSTIPQVAAGIP